MTPQSSRLDNGRPTIAIIAGSLASNYHEGIMRGAAYVAEEKGYNVIGYCGGVINSPDARTLARSKVFELVDMGLISGVIIPFSSHTRYSTPQDCQTFLKQFQDVPVVNIGSQIPHFTNIITDYKVSMIELFHHYYHQHNYRNIVLVRGPKNHASSEKRMQIFLDLLKQHGLEQHQHSVIYCDLKREAAKHRLSQLFEQENGISQDNRSHSKYAIDAIITINDNQALGVMDACKEHGLVIPDDIAVAGSMNTLEGAFCNPSLTTIKEPLFELGQAAALELVAQIEGRSPADTLEIPTELIIRESCGCKCHSQSNPFSQPLSLQPSHEPKSRDWIFDQTKQSFYQLVEQHKGAIIHRDVDRILQAFHHSVEHDDFVDLLATLETRLNHALMSEDIMFWLSLVSQLQRSCLNYLQISDDRDNMLHFMSQLTIIKSEVEQLAVQAQSFEAEHYLNCFRIIVNNLNTSFDLTTIKHYAVDTLQLSELYISLFEDLKTDDEADAIRAKNIVSVRKNQFIGISNKQLNAKKLIPQEVERFNERYSLMVFPLAFGSKAIGFMTTNISHRKGTAFENLREIISSALKNEMLIQNLRDAEERFSDIAHSTSNWLWETNEHHRFTYCSNSTLDIIGYEPSYFIDKGIDSLNIKQHQSLFFAIAQHKDLVDIECWCQHKNGRLICMLVSAKAIYQNGKFNGYRGVFEDITEQKTQEQKIRNLAYTDTLTGLPNRAMLHDTLEQTIIRSNEQQQKFAVMFIDLDHFKHVNDSMGHDAGDLLLVKVTERLTASVGPKETLARLGGDEFVIISSDINAQEEVIKLIHRIFYNLKQPIDVYNKPIYSTLSLGISLYPKDGTDAETLLKKGDSAMYQAKSQGRNGYVFYDHQLELKNSLRNTYERILRQAIEKEQFVLHYQPQVSLLDNSIIGCEVLVRIHSDNGLVPPNLFIPVAEELGLIQFVDEWVFEHACAQYATWKAELGITRRLSINLSALQLQNESIVETYIAIMQKYRVEPADIVLEITENALIDNEEVALTILQTFKQFGVQIAFDDFGTGYSSLSYISRYPIDTIKIDRSFVTDSINNPRNKAIIEGIVLLASSLDLRIVAEGVETVEQYHCVKKLGCHDVQGYYFYKPAAANEIAAMMTEHHANAQQLYSTPVR
ncbi:EAL domain-containing protein [Vibrio hippocampi]|uniref:HTH-type transcriptional repressor PurR n=1 Tax=Vibrio hippocampi TaxID=654686 RepID=A0ABN8DSB9_9VIBR|nr:EAL domain-containing protein [Vibrio hippocampi]CAH0529906.1 HTH-type transcriptional repressor PurR [Vibrio hippocampi]